MEASVGGDTECECRNHEAKERVYREAGLELDTCNRRRVMLAPRHPPSPAALLHQEMVHGRAEPRQATTNRIVLRAQAGELKEATDSEAGPSHA
jgi:hypothetical protein